MVYFIQTADNRFIKIGTAENPLKRLSGIQTSLPYRVRLIGIMHGDRRVEQNVHERFRNDRARGEWFHTTTDLARYAIYEGAPLLYRVYTKSTAENTFEKLTKIDSGILELHARATAICDPDTESYFCANSVWYRHFKTPLTALVGWYSQLPYKELHSSEAYSAAYKTIYNALPDCRGCMCG